MGRLLNNESTANPYQSPNRIKEKYKRPDTDWGLAFILFLVFTVLLASSFG